MLRIAFLGSAQYSVPSLRACAVHTDVVRVVTQPDRPGDRGRPAPRPVADAAADLGLPVWQPEKIRLPEAADELLALNLDALVVAAYGQILPGRLLDGPRFGGVNVHFSLLPRWRGAAPVAAAILHGDAESGVTIMKMEAGLDTGPMYAMRRVVVPPDATTPRLSAELAELGAEMLLGVLADLEVGRAMVTAQDEAAATYAPRLTRADGVIDWTSMTAAEVGRRIRALSPWPGVTAELAGERVRLVAGDAVGEADGGGGVVKQSVTPAAGIALGRADGVVVVGTAGGAFRVDRVVPPGRREMTAAEFLRGHRRAAVSRSSQS